MTQGRISAAGLQLNQAESCLWCACVCVLVCVLLQQMTNRGSFMEDYSESTLNNEINVSEVTEGQRGINKDSKGNTMSVLHMSRRNKTGCLS